MNAEKAYEILKLNGWNLYKNGNAYFEVSRGGDWPDEEISPRVLIKRASYYTSENQREYKKNTKKYRHKNNRQATKEDIHNENFDNFSHNQLREDENIWNWD